MLEVHNVGSGSAAACHDLLRNPEQRVDCSAVSSDHQKAPGHSTQEGIYSGKLRSVTPSSIELSHSRLEHDVPLTPVPYQVRLVGSGTVLAKLDLYHLQGEFSTGPTRPEVAVLPVPGQERAAVLVRGIDTAPGNGHQGWLLRWVQLSANEHPSLVDGVEWAREVGAPAPAADAAKAIVTRENNAGFKLHQQGKYAEAARHFLRAVQADPEGALLPRYNLACAYARLNQPDQAMETLQELFAKTPRDQAEKRRQRAKVDEDLASLRSRADFQALMCGPACTSAPAASSPAAPAATPALATAPATPAEPPEPSKFELLSCAAAPGTLPAPGASACLWLLVWLGYFRRSRWGARSCLPARAPSHRAWARQSSSQSTSGS